MMNKSRFGSLTEAMTAGAYAEFLSGALGDSVRRMGPANALIHRVGICSGGGSQEWELALANECDAFITGEIKHHHALAMADAGIVAFECGHAATERPGMQVLADALQNALDTVECNLRIFMSARDLLVPARSCMQARSSFSIPIGNAPLPTAGSQIFTSSRALSREAFSPSVKPVVSCERTKLRICSDFPIFTAVSKYATRLSRHMYCTISLGV